MADDEEASDFSADWSGRTSLLASTCPFASDNRGALALTFSSFSIEPLGRLCSGDASSTELTYCIVLYCIVLYCFVLRCIVLYCIVLYCTVLTQQFSGKDVIKQNTCLQSLDIG